MHIKPIHNEKEHRAVLKEIERLWSARPGSPEHDRLEILATLVGNRPMKDVDGMAFGK